MLAGLILTLSVVWPRHAPPPPPPPRWYWQGPGPMPPLPADCYWSAWPDGLLYRVYRRDHEAVRPMFPGLD